jgi:hypothetical protein
VSGANGKREVRAPGSEASELIEHADGSLLDLVDHLLDKGVIVEGQIVISVAEVDLIYLRLSLILCAAGKLLPWAESGSKRART